MSPKAADRPRRTARTLLRAFAAAALVATIACAPERPPALNLAPAGFEDLPGWDSGRQAGALAALRRSCTRFGTLPLDRPVGPDGVGGTIADWRPACDAASTVPDGDDAAGRAYFERWFRPFAATDNGESEGLFTGYYEPQLRGSRSRETPFSTPVYARPEELVLVDLGRFRESLRGERIAGKVVAGGWSPMRRAPRSTPVRCRGGT